MTDTNNGGIQSDGRGHQEKIVRRDPITTAQLLARLIRQELEVEVSPETIVDLIKKRWKTLSSLAHEIHRETQ